MAFETWLKQGSDGEWHHDDGTVCPAFMASRPASEIGNWWCTEHQQYLTWRPDPSGALTDEEWSGFAEGAGFEPEHSYPVELHEALHLLKACHQGHGWRWKRKPDRCTICAFILSADRTLYPATSSRRRSAVTLPHSGRHSASGGS